MTLTNDGHCLLASCLDSTVRLVDCESGELLQSFVGHRNNEFRVAACAAPDDACVISGSECGRIFVWDLVEGGVVASLAAHSKSVSAVLACRRDERTVIVSCSADCTIKVFAEY